MDSFFRVRDKVINFKDPTVRACVFAYFPPALLTILLLVLLIVCSIFSSTVNACYKQQLLARQQDLLLSSTEINVLLLTGESEEFRSKLRSVTKFIYTRYGRFIRTQLNFEITVSTYQRLDEDKFAADLVDQLENYARNPLVAHSEFGTSCGVLRDFIMRRPEVGEPKKLNVHLLNKDIMECSAKFLEISSAPSIAVMVENSPSGYDVVSISNITNHRHLNEDVRL